MYYEEKVIDGVLCARGTPDGEWMQLSKVALTELLIAARDRIALFEQQAEDAYFCMDEVD